MRIEDIPRAQISVLAQILYRPLSEPREDYVPRMFCLEQQLDRHYLRPDFLHRLVQRPQSYYTVLCEVHKILNAKVVHQIFMLLANEVGLRLNSLVVAGRDKLGRETWDVSILNLRSLHGAWLQPEVFWDTFGHTLDVPKNGFSDEDYMTRWIKEGETCEACILARIGGDVDTVFDLQMLIKSRTHTRSVRRFKQPRLNGLIEGWLDVWKFSYDADKWKAKLEWNRLRGERLKGVRRRLAKEKRRARLARNGGAADSKRHRKSKVTEPAIEHPRQRTDKELASMKSNRPRLRDSEETLKAWSSSNPSKQETDPTSRDSSEDEDEPEIRHTLHAAENEIIDCYAALISTPFLPGMDIKEHQRRASTLSLFRGPMATQEHDPSWPMVANKNSDQQLGRSQSTRQRPPSNYSESVYSQVSNSFQAATNFPPTRQRDSSSTLKRATSLQDKRASDKSWLTASIASSAATSPISPRSTNRTHKPTRSDRKFDAISEETATPHRSTSNRYSETSISPVKDSGDNNDNDYYYNHFQFQHDSSTLNRNGRHSPVSPISPTSVPRISRPKSQRHDSKHYSRPDSRVQSRSDNRDSTITTSTLPPALKPRLSRPFSGPSAQASSLLASARRLRDHPEPELESLGRERTRERGREREHNREREHESQRERGHDRGRPRDRPSTNDTNRNGDSDRYARRGTAATDSTTWSAVFGDQRERIRRLEDTLRGLEVDEARGGKEKERNGERGREKGGKR